MLCDAHIHFIPYELSLYTSFYKGAWTDRGQLRTFLDEHAIEKALLVYPSTDAHLQLKSHKQVCLLYNEAAEKLMEEDKRILAAGIVDITDKGSIPAQIEGLHSRDFRAVSIASSHNGTFSLDEVKAIFSCANEYSLAIFVHPQTMNPIGYQRVQDPLLMPVLEYSFDISMLMGLLMMEGVFTNYNVPCIFSSLGGVMPFLKDRFDRVYQMLRERQMVKDLGQLPSQILKNVYVDTSGASLANIQMAIDLFGETKVLWGSDYPVSGSVAQNLKMLKSLRKDVICNITHANFMGVFKEEE